MEKKKYKMLRCEKETVVNMNDADKILSLSTSQDWMKRRIRKLAESNPEEVKITNEDDYTLFAELPAKWLHIRPPRKVSEEQRLAAAERLRKYRASLNEDDEYDSEDEYEDDNELEEDELEEEREEEDDLD